LPREHRDRYEITAEILKSAVAGALKLQIMFKARPSSTQVETYTAKLVEEGLLEFSSVKEHKRIKKIYKTTEKGKHFVKNYDLLKKLGELEQLPFF